MRKLASAAAALLWAASAQAAPPTEFTLTVTPAELQVIGDALGAQPYSKVASLLAKMQAQVNAETAKAEAPAPAPPAPPAPKPEAPKK